MKIGKRVSITDPMWKILTWDISTSIRDLVHSYWQWNLLDKLFYSLSSDVIPGGTGLPFFDELVKNPVQLVGPLVFVHRVVSPATNPYWFFEPSCRPVRFSVNLFSLVPPNNMVLSHSVFSRRGFEDNTYSELQRLGPVWVVYVTGRITVYSPFRMTVNQYSRNCYY